MTTLIQVLTLSAVVGACTLSVSGGLGGPGGDHPPAMTTQGDPAIATRKPAAEDPYGVLPCPGDLSLAVGPRKIDGREPAETIRATYAKEHMKAVRADALLSREDAIAKMIALEGKKPGLIPAGFRAEVTTKGRDPRFRPHMARCELHSDQTLRRAGYDAGLAFLLGATVGEVLPIVKESFYPDGTLSTSCTADADCGDVDKCDRLTRSCGSPKRKTAAFLSAAELDVEDTLVRAFAAMLTPEMLEDHAYDPNDLIGTWAYGRYSRCGGVLCKFTRYQSKLVHWDRRYQGESYSGPSDGGGNKTSTTVAGKQLGNGNGTKCSFDSDCASNRCSFSVCKAQSGGESLANGMACSFDASCESNHCSFQVCAAQPGSAGKQLANGIACSFDSDCGSNRCSFEVCKAQ